MSKLIIEGGKKLEGRIKVAGDKNSTLAILAASILTKGELVLENVPEIKDVFVLLKILGYLGVNYKWPKTNTLWLDTKKTHYEDLLIDEVKQLRASIILLGSVLARFGKIKIHQPGGDIIGARPVEVHMTGLKDLGAELDSNHIIIEAKFKAVRNKKIILQEPSVTGTEVLILAANLVNEAITLKLVATEPAVQNLCKFLQKLGVKIQGLGTPFLIIAGSKKLKTKIKFRIPADTTEIATFCALAGATKSNLEISPLEESYLDSLFLALDAMNLRYKILQNRLKIYPSKLKGIKKLQTGLYPKFLSDYQAPFGAMLTQANGVSLIHDWLYENRFGYINELVYMGANAEILDPHRALIIGPTPLIGKEVKSLDIRSGIALVIAGLSAKGETIIYEAEKIDRGYEKIEERLKKIGAKIKREE
jgi:UDP-N-acetylglucosamine 1-carboxyvinyltransferase